MKLFTHHHRALTRFLHPQPCIASLPLSSTGRKVSLARSISDKSNSRRSGVLPPIAPVTWNQPPSPSSARAASPVNRDRVERDGARKDPSFTGKDNSNSSPSMGLATSIGTSEDLCCSSGMSVEEIGRRVLQEGEGLVPAIEVPASTTAEEKNVCPETLEVVGPSGSMRPSARNTADIGAANERIPVAAPSLPSVAGDGSSSDNVATKEGQLVGSSSSLGPAPLDDGSSGGRDGEVPRRRGRPQAATPSVRLAPDGDSLLLPDSIESGLSAHQRASEVADALRSHRDHSLLRHSPLGASRRNFGEGGLRDIGLSKSPIKRREDERVVNMALSPGGIHSFRRRSSGGVPLVRGRGTQGDEGVVSRQGDGVLATTGRGRAAFEGSGQPLNEGLGASEDDYEALDRYEESTAVTRARELRAQGLISAEELEAVVRKDQVCRF